MVVVGRQFSMVLSHVLYVLQAEMLLTAFFLDCIFQGGLYSEQPWKRVIVSLQSKRQVCLLFSIIKKSPFKVCLLSVQHGKGSITLQSKR